MLLWRMSASLIMGAQWWRTVTLSCSFPGIAVLCNLCVFIYHAYVFSRGDQLLPAVKIGQLSHYRVVKSPSHTLGQVPTQTHRMQISPPTLWLHFLFPFSVLQRARVFYFDEV